MGIAAELQGLPIQRWVADSRHTSRTAVEAVLARSHVGGAGDLGALLSPAAGAFLEPLAQRARQVTRRHFGQVMRLFAPLYLSNECVNICRYCGFSRNNPIPRITIPVHQARDEAQKLRRQGFRSLLIVAGEHPKYVSNGYVGEVIRACLPLMPGIALELGPVETPQYVPLVEAGAEGLVVYQETYHAETYRAMHPAGPKKRFAWRMEAPERAAAAGFRRLGLGFLVGLYDWRYEAFALAAHVEALLQRCWKAQITLSFPRLRPAAGGFEPDPAHVATDREFVQMLLAFRLCFPTVGLVVSTREHPALRNGLVQLGVTHMSAGSSTEPGGYSSFDENSWTAQGEQPGEQFHIADERAPAVVAAMLRAQGYEPVWKDFDQSLVSAAAPAAALAERGAA